MTKTIPVFLAMSLLAIGCADKSAEEAGADMKDTAESAGEMAADTMEDAGEMAEEAMDEAAAVMAGEEGQITVAGTVGCGHCNYGIGDSCSAAMQTADGTIYLLEGVDDTPVFTDRKSGKEIQVVGVAKEVDGVQTIVVETWEM